MASKQLASELGSSSQAAATRVGASMMRVTAGVQHGGALPDVAPPLPSTPPPPPPADLLDGVKSVDPAVQELQDSFATVGLPDGPQFQPFATHGRTHVLTADLSVQPTGINCQPRLHRVGLTSVSSCQTC